MLHEWLQNYLPCEMPFVLIKYKDFRIFTGILNDVLSGHLQLEIFCDSVTALLPIWTNKFTLVD